MTLSASCDEEVWHLISFRDLVGPCVTIDRCLSPSASKVTVSMQQVKGKKNSEEY